MRSKILIFSILETLLAVDDWSLDDSESLDNLKDLDDLKDWVLGTTPIMPAWKTTTEYYPEDTTTERIITVLDQMENIENHRSRFINYVTIRGPWHKDDDDLSSKIQGRGRVMLSSPTKPWCQ